MGGRQDAHLYPALNLERLKFLFSRFFLFMLFWPQRQFLGLKKKCFLELLIVNIDFKRQCGKQCLNPLK